MITFTDETWQWLMLGLDAVVLYTLQKWYQHKVKSAEEIEVSDFNDQWKVFVQTGYI